MRTPRGLFGPGRAFTKPCRPLTFPSSPVGTPESESCIRPMCCPSSRSSRMVMRSCTYESEDFCFALPVKERRALARERLSSYREPASRNPQDARTRLLREPCTRTPFRLLSIRAPRQAVLRTSSWLAPSDTNRPCDLPVEKTRDASNRCLPPKRTTCTRTLRVPSSLSPLSQRGYPAES
jgi:hypothetical protein